MLTDSLPRKDSRNSQWCTDVRKAFTVSLCAQLLARRKPEPWEMLGRKGAKKGWGELTASLGKEDRLGSNGREESSVIYVYSDLRSESWLFLATHKPNSEHLFGLYKMRIMIAPSWDCDKN